MYYTLIRHINLFNIRNLSFRIAWLRSVFFVLLPVFLYTWCQPLGDVLLLISYICIYERSRFDSKSYLDYIHLSSFSISGVNKFTVMYLSHLLNCKFLFFTVVTVISVINGYFSIFQTSVMLFVLLILSLFTLNMVLMAMRSVKMFHIIKTVFSIIIPLPFLLIYTQHDIRDRLTDFYDNNTFPVFLTLALLLPVCLILNYRLFKYTVCRKPFPSPDVIEKIRKRRYFSLF
jgi:hypothetical protein